MYDSWMNVLMLARLYEPHVGGVEKHLKEINKRLIKKGYSIRVVTEKFNPTLVSRETVGKVKILRVDYPKRRFVGLLYIWYWFWKNRKIVQEADIVHIHDVFIWYLPLRFFYLSKKVYMTFHGWEGTYPVPKRNVFLNKMAAFFSRGSLSAGKFIEKYYGIKTDQDYYTAVIRPRKHNYSKKKNMIVYVGRLDKDTGLLKILRALKSVKSEIEVHFCGDGLLKKECEEIGTVHGFVDPRPFLKKAGVSVSPGLTSILESLVYKCRVITTYDSVLKKDYLLMTPFKKWVVVKGSTIAVALEIDKFIKGIDDGYSEIEKGYDWATTQTWDYITDLYLKLWSK